MKPARPNRTITVMYITDTCISPPDSPFKGGAEKQLYLIANSLNPAHFRPIVVQLSPYKSLPLTNGRLGVLAVFHFPTRRVYSLNGLRQFARLCQLARREKVDIIHTFFEKSEVMGWLAVRLTNIANWVTSRRDLGFKRSKIFNYIFKFTGRDCKRCVAVCRAVKDQMVLKEGGAPEKIDVIYNGLDFSPYKQPARSVALRNELGVDDNVVLVGMIANFYLEIKGHGYFLKAAKKVLQKVTDVEFVLIGDGHLRYRYEEMAREIGLKEKVHFLGNRSDVPSILSNLNISVLSSLSEGFSNTLLESMAAARPVVATRVGGNSEIVIDGTTGYLVPPENPEDLADAITILLQNPQKAMAMGAAGKKLVEEKFTIESMVNSYERLYKSLLSEI